MTRLLPWRSLAGLALQLAILSVLVAAFFIRTPQVSGLSMEPGIASGEYVLIDTVAYRFGHPHRGDVIAFRHDVDGTSEVFIKRIVGLPGDTVRVSRGRVYVNGAALREPYVRYDDDRSFAAVAVPSGAVYALGDNRANSEDSRFFGPVSDADILGRAIYGIWPLGSIGAL